MNDLKLTRRIVVAGLASACTGAVSQPRDASSDPADDAGLDDGGLPDAGVSDAGHDAGVVVAAPVGKHLFQQGLLFQRAHVRSLPHTYTNSLGQPVTVPGNVATFDGMTSQGAGICGSTSELLCAASRRPWTNPGGDWIDAQGTSQGSTPFATARAATGQTSGVLTFDVTSAVEWMFRRKHWLAFLVKATGGGCSTPGVLGTATPAGLTFTDAAGTIEQLACWYTASPRRSTAYTNAQEAEIVFGDDGHGLFEFHRPSRPNERSCGTSNNFGSQRRPLRRVLGSEDGSVPLHRDAGRPIGCAGSATCRQSCTWARRRSSSMPPTVGARTTRPTNTCT